MHVHRCERGRKRSQMFVLLVVIHKYRQNCPNLVAMSENCTQILCEGVNRLLCSSEILDVCNYILNNDVAGSKTSVLLPTTLWRAINPHTMLVKA
jgi:hypothetical protein